MYQQYSYDFLNRLAMYLDVGSNLTTYRYDALGRRITKSYNGLLTHYVYDGAGLIEERDGGNGVVARSFSKSCERGRSQAPAYGRRLRAVRGPFSGVARFPGRRWRTPRSGAGRWERGTDRFET